jgi:hypothetical protein
MISYSSVKRVIIFIIGNLVLVFSSIANSNENALISTCNLNDASILSSVNFNTFERKEIKVMGKSAEGGLANIYKKDGEIYVIKSTFFGGTGKTEINYFFDLENRTRYLVELKDYRYTVPIYVPGSKIASKSINKFVVCENLKPNYPNSSDLENIYNRAVITLEAISSSF